jgi:UDP-N-acetylglucosamine 2-epimerase (non-hydrolysing)
VPFLTKLKSNQWKPSGIPPLWDGKTSERIVAKLLQLYGKKEAAVPEAEKAVPVS